MIRSALAGLRGRLLLAFVATSAVTLAIAVAITLSPLQDQLRAQNTKQLRTTTETLRSDFAEALKLGPTKEDQAQAKRSEKDPDAERIDLEDRARSRRASALIEVGYDLRDRTNARVLVADTSFTSSLRESPDFLFDTGSGQSGAGALALALQARREGAAETQLSDDMLTFAMPVYDDEGIIGVVVAQRSLTDVADTVSLMRTRFLTAAAIGLAVAIALATHALEHAHAPARAAAAGRAPDHRRRPRGAAADRSWPRRGRRPGPGDRPHAGGAAPPGGGAPLVRLHRLARAPDAADDALRHDGAARRGPA